MNDLWTKSYDDAEACRIAAANHRWLAGLGTVPVPELRSIGTLHLGFETIRGRHAVPGDLTTLAIALGKTHRAAYNTDLRSARLSQPYETSAGHLIPDFITPRRDAIRARLADSSVPGRTLDVEQLEQLMHLSDHVPAAFYKDTNLRNILIASHGPVFVDFDDLTLAPFGYDLAKLIVTLAMTYGAVSTVDISRALAAYNSAIARGRAELAPISWNDLMTWAEMHHVLTSPYLGCNGYRHSWHDLRPAAPGGPHGSSTTLG